MQASSGGGGNVEGGEGIGPGRLGGGGGGLHRFRSAPATWLDVLLDDDLTRDDSFRIGPNNPGGLTHLLSAGTAVPPLPPPQAPTGIARSNSTSAYNISAAVADSGFFDAATSGGGGGGGVGVGTVQSLHRHAPNSLEAFNRMNSSPAEFLSSNVDAYFSSFGGGGGGFPSTNYEMLGGAAPLEVSPSSSGKRIRERDAEFPSPSKFPSQLKEELGSGGSLLDMDMEKLLEDTVPFRVRAKRGCATHPRSIAERVRRTKISDRIRKLQELVPNMDKQTNTADMLDEAVEYVKHLQKQIEELTEHQKKCICPARD